MREVEKIEREANSPDELAQLLVFVEGLRKQMKDVTALKMQYEEEDARDSYTPPWKRAVGDRHVAPSRQSPMSQEERYAPALTVEQMQCTYEGLPEGWFHLCVAARMMNVTGNEMRRQFFWMSRRKYILFSNALGMFRKRVGNELHNFSNMPVSGPFGPSSLPRTDKKAPTFT